MSKGDAYGAVAKELLKRSWVSSSSKEQCGGGGGSRWAQPNIKEQRLEAPLAHVGRVKELSNLCSEYES